MNETEGVKSLDRKVFDQILKALKSGDAKEHVSTIEETCVRSRGREAFRVLDKEYQYDRKKLAAEASRDLYAATCSSENQLEAYMKVVKHSRFILKITKERRGIQIW